MMVFTTVYLCKNASATAKSVLQSFGEKRSKLLTCQQAACERSTTTLTIPTQRLCLLGLCVPEKDPLVNDVSLQLFWPALLPINTNYSLFCFILYLSWLAVSVLPAKQREEQNKTNKNICKIHDTTKSNPQMYTYKRIVCPIRCKLSS